nr:MAG TPA: hypothetical protein [Caudoviricetes sp.]
MVCRITIFFILYKYIIHYLRTKSQLFCEIFLR